MAPKSKKRKVATIDHDVDEKAANTTEAGDEKDANVPVDDANIIDIQKMVRFIFLVPCNMLTLLYVVVMIASDTRCGSETMGQ